MKKVVITGVSTGIGYSSAKILCDSGYFVYGSVRNNKDSEKLSLELGSNFQPLIFDVTDSKSILENIKKVKGVSDVNLKLVWEPPWDKDKMSEAAKLELNL